MNFDNKVVLVTGASSGIGAVTAELFAKHGADVVIVARNENKLKAVAANCAKVGKEPLILVGDITNDDAVKRIIDQTIDKYDKLDILVNNAGIIRIGSIIDGTILDTYDEIMNTNIRSMVRLTTLSTPYLMKTKGNIVNVSSTAATVSRPQFGASCISKSAVNQFSCVAALELAPHGVRVNAVSPGPVYTDALDNAGIKNMTFTDFASLCALNRVSAPEEIGDLILFLASDKAKSITGSNYVLDNGYTLKL